MRRAVWLLSAHAILLLAACTELMAVSWLWTGEFAPGINVYQYSSFSSWRSIYVSPYPLWQVLLYVLAYGLGIMAFGQLRGQRMPVVALAGLLVCWLGFGSFVYESTHWMFASTRAWILSLPVVSLSLATMALGRLAWRGSQATRYLLVRPSGDSKRDRITASV